jgi:hypothetical protein
MPEKPVEIQGLSPPKWQTAAWQPVPWEPPEAWGCSKEKKEVPASFKTRGLGLPFRPARPRRRSERETLDETAPDE